MTSLSPSVQFLSQPEDLVEIERYCPRCKECWPLTSEFWGKDSKRRDGLARNCKACQAEGKLKVVCTVAPETPSKACIGCKVVKPLTKACWHGRADSPDGFRGVCIDCNSKARNTRRAKITALVVAPPPAFVVTPDTLFKVCKICFEIKPNDIAFWHKCQRYGLRKECKSCRKVAVKAPRRKRSAPAVELAPLEDRLYGIKRVYVKKPVAPIVVCRTCKQSKAQTSEFFAVNRKSSTGFKFHCKICCSEYQKAFTKKRQDAMQALKELADVS
jgi:hypothetical protein